ncbi:unnamed protein product [Linum trigynum]|uniref:Uncharacterized protein n=1 Tax=Linum trigynum TaxID=586398 RepID=A0AAV2EK01_9ROSI
MDSDWAPTTKRHLSKIPIQNLESNPRISLTTSIPLWVLSWLYPSSNLNLDGETSNPVTAELRFVVFVGWVCEI